MAIEFFRQPTSEERTNFTPLPIVKQQENAMELLSKRLDEAEKKFSETFKPFCARCARMDFRDLMEDKIREYERKVGHVDFDKFKVELPDLEKYGEPSRFVFLRDMKAMEPIPGTFQNKDGQVMRQTQIGIHRDYKCKERGCGISMFIPLDKIKETQVSELSDSVKEKVKSK